MPNDPILHSPPAGRRCRRASGGLPDRGALGFLHDMLTADVANLAPGSGRIAALLTDKGRLRAVVRVLALTGGDAMLDFDPAAERGFDEGLGRVAPLAGVEVVSDARVLIRLSGDVPRSLIGDLGANPGDHAALADAVVVRTHYGADLLIEPGSLGVWQDRLREAGAVEDADALEAARIRDGLPRFGADADDTTLINETPLLETAVSFSKGCYPGQESVARVRNLGRVRHALIALIVDGPIPQAGAIVTASDGVEAGRVTSAGRDAAGTVAFARLAVGGTDAGELRVGSAPASVLASLGSIER